MIIESYNTADGITYVVSGRVTFADHKHMRELVRAVERRDFPKVVFDLEKIEFIDSSAIGMLLLVRETAIAHGVEIAIKGARGRIAKLLAVARFDQLFAMV